MTLSDCFNGVGFIGDNNQGVQLGENSGNVNVTINNQQASSPAEPPPKPSHTIPFGNDEDFVSRDVFDQLCERASKPGLRTALVGLGGVGKSKLAVEFGHKTRAEDSEIWVFWVHGSSTERFEEGYRKIAEYTRLSKRNDPDVNILQLVYNWLSDDRNGKWLLILDNLDEDKTVLSPEAGNSGTKCLADYLPIANHGSILITSRSKYIAERIVGTLRGVILVEPMKTTESIKLLQRKLADSYQENDLVNLADKLDHMPLALTQAAGFIKRRWPRWTVARYLEEFENSDEERMQLLERDQGDIWREKNASNSVISTLHISFKYIWENRSSAAKLLSFMSCFDREAIPDELLIDRTSGDVEMFEEDALVLQDYFLIGAKDERNFEMHRLVQSSVMRWLEINKELPSCQQSFLSLMKREFPSGRFETWPKCRALLPHAMRLISFKFTTNEACLMVADVLGRIGHFLDKTGQYRDATKVFEKCYEIRTNITGPDSPETLWCMNELAGLYSLRGQWDQAEPISRQVLETRTRLLGPRNPATITSMDGLAMLYFHRGEWKEAEKLELEVFEMRQSLLGENHGETLTAMHNLGVMYLKMTKLDEAEAYLLRALQGREKKYGSEHPSPLKTKTTIVKLRQHQGRPSEAIALMTECVAAGEKVWGLNHKYQIRYVEQLKQLHSTYGE